MIAPKPLKRLPRWPWQKPQWDLRPFEAVDEAWLAIDRGDQAEATRLVDFAEASGVVFPGTIAFLRDFIAREKAL